MIKFTVGHNFVSASERSYPIQVCVAAHALCIYMCKTFSFCTQAQPQVHTIKYFFQQTKRTRNPPREMCRMFYPNYCATYK